MRIASFIFLLFFLSYCENSEPVDDTYVSIYVLTRLANTEFGSTTKKAEQFRASIFKHYNIKEGLYISEIARLKNDPEQWQLFQDRVIADIKQRDSALDHHQLRMIQLDSLRRDSLLNDSINREVLVDTLTLDSTPLIKDTLK
ncbi:MAG: hypothetical protein OCC49_10660 [Fibrobacterales bacterium]